MSGLLLDRLRIGYPGRPVLPELNLRVPDGEILAVLGPSGCGKSTLLRTVAGLRAPLSGRVLVGDVPVTGPGRDRVLVFQDDALLPWRRVRGNVELSLAIRGVPRAARRAESSTWLQRVGLAEAARLLPGQLSGGMRQRAQLARALASDPGLLLMDEPFAALDRHTRAAMQELLLRVWQARPRTILFVTHDVAEALTLGHRVAVLCPDEPDHPVRLVDTSTDPAGARNQVLAVLGATANPI